MTNRFQGLYLTECLKNCGQRFMTLYRRQRSRPSPRKRNGCLRREEKLKAKEKKQRYTHLNVEFQRIARREKKAFLSDQCKEIEEKNRMGKTRDLFKKIRDTKGTYHAKMSTIKDRNGMDLIEAEDIKKRWQECTELYKRDLHDADNHNGVITHLEQRSWNAKSSGLQEASLRTKLVEVMEFQLSYFKS